MLVETSAFQIFHGGNLTFTKALNITGLFLI